MKHLIFIFLLFLFFSCENQSSLRFEVDGICKIKMELDKMEKDGLKNDPVKIRKFNSLSDKRDEMIRHLVKKYEQDSAKTRELKELLSSCGN